MSSNGRSLKDICLVVHSYGGWIGSGAVEQIGDRVSSIVWLDAYKPENGQKPVDLTNEAFRKLVLVPAEKGGASFCTAAEITANLRQRKRPRLRRLEADARIRSARICSRSRFLVRARRWQKRPTFAPPKFPNPLFDKALAECKADPSWNTLETNAYHIVMLDEPEWLADTLIKVA